MRFITFHVAGAPVPKQSTRFVGGHCYTSARVANWQTAVSLSAKAQLPEGWEPWPGKAWVTMAFCLPDGRKRDLDNLSKGVLDGMKGIVFEDDAQVTRLELTKFVDKTRVGVLVRVELL